LVSLKQTAKRSWCDVLRHLALTLFLFCSYLPGWNTGELLYKVVRLEPGGQEVIVRAGNYEICKAAFDKALFVYPSQPLELRQGARVICKSKED
jgi:hypothetical protein